MPPRIKPIETNYRGYRFRSRLEARWAVFFDQLNLKWEYEPEGYRLANGQGYLPDFRVVSPQGNVTWYEVKPTGGGSDSKMEEFEDSHAGDGGLTSFITLQGDPYGLLMEWRKWAVCPRCGLIAQPAYGCDFRQDDEILVGCRPCDMNTPDGGGHPNEEGLFCRVRPHKGYVVVDSALECAFYALKIENACVAARSARFEHGENGA